MAKISISSTDLTWIFTEKLRSSPSFLPGTTLAIVPSKEGWTALMNTRRRVDYPECARRIKQLQKKLRGIYVLAKD
jgi:hypothetical protein